MKIHPAITQISSIFFSVERVEMYLIKSEKIALIDTGTNQSPQNDIAPALKGLGLTLADIDLILNTHGHPDHIGGNATVKSVSNAQILIHTQDAISLQDHERSFELYFAPVLEALFGKEFLKEEKARFLEMAGPDIAVDRALEDNDVIHLGNECELCVIHLPGHNAGSVGFYWEKEGILFSGDSLPGLHNHTGGLPIISDFQAYQRSLERLQGLPVQLMLQSHPFRGLSLPPSPIKQGEEIKQYLRDSSQVAEWISEAVSRIAPDIFGKPFMEIADKVVATLPEKAGFKPISEIPMPRFNALTILSALNRLKQ